MVQFILLICIIGFTVYFLAGKTKRKPPAPVAIDRSFLEKNVLFFSRLTEQEKEVFEKNIIAFLQDVNVTGVDTVVNPTHKLLVASAAIIPIFHFKGWQYHNLKEVLLYSDSINMSFETTGNEDRNILGMVGSGVYEGKMFLSKHSLEQGFFNKTDKNNTAIHEFVHLIDKMDGDTDGIPRILMDKQFLLPWLNLIKEQVQQISKRKSDINPYATMSNAEFFAVAAEYFFERPDLLDSKHPQLYGMMKEMFDGK